VNDVIQKSRNDEHNTLMLLGKARELLIEARNYDEAAKIRSQAEALRAYSQQQKLSVECYNYAAEIKLRAERKMGAFLRRMEKNKGGEHSHRQTTGRGESTSAPTLDELGITKDESARYQRLARVPEKCFDEIVVITNENRERLTTQRVLKEAEERGFLERTLKNSAATAATTTSPDGKVVVPVDLLLKEEQTQPFVDAMQILGEEADQLIFDTVIAAAKKEVHDETDQAHSHKAHA
jgi:hypothetical protein